MTFMNSSEEWNNFLIIFRSCIYDFLILFEIINLFNNFKA